MAHDAAEMTLERREGRSTTIDPERTERTQQHRSCLALQKTFSSLTIISHPLIAACKDRLSSYVILMFSCSALCCATFARRRV